jgi:predicted RNA-binding Zn ribbon-like protein
MEGRIWEHSFQAHDLVGGHVVLNFVNTITARNAEPVDWLDGYPRLLEWAALTGEFAPTTLAALRRASARDPKAEASALRSAKHLRETLWDLLSATVEGRPLPTPALQHLQRHWKAAITNASLNPHGNHLTVTLDVGASRLEYISHVLALRAVALLETLPLDRTRICAGPQCGWLFLDSSKAGKRRWCDMATCGNAAKTSRYQQRRRALPPARTARSGGGSRR